MIRWQRDEVNGNYKSEHFYIQKVSGRYTLWRGQECLGKRLSLKQAKELAESRCSTPEQPIGYFGEEPDPFRPFDPSKLIARLPFLDEGDQLSEEERRGLEDELRNRTPDEELDESEREDIPEKVEANRLKERLPLKMKEIPIGENGNPIAAGVVCKCPADFCPAHGKNRKPQAAS